MKRTAQWSEIQAQLTVLHPEQLLFSASENKKIVAVGCKERQCVYIFIYTKEGWKEHAVLTKEHPARKSARVIPEHIVFGDKVSLTRDGMRLTVVGVHGKTPIPFMYERAGETWRRLV